MTFAIERTLIPSPPFTGLDATRSWLEQGLWPCTWITHPTRPAPPCQLAFRLPVPCERETRFRIHVAADERYDLFVDGELAGRGSERGMPEGWFFDTYDLTLSPGAHWLTAVVISAGASGMRAQASVQPGFLLVAETGELATGRAAWEVKILKGLSYERPFDHDYFSIGWNSVWEGKQLDWSAAAGGGEGWAAPLPLHPGSSRGRRNRYGAIHLLTPARLPAARGEPYAGGRVRHLSADCSSRRCTEAGAGAELERWTQWWRHGAALELGAQQQRRLLIDLDDYVCARPEFVLTGGAGASVSVAWAESLFLDEEFKAKGVRTEIEGKYFYGIGDTFRPDGGPGRVFRGPFVRAGRYLELKVITGAAPLTLLGLRLRQADYPLEITARATVTDRRWRSLFERCQRTVRRASMDALVDPYYEQMAWIGDFVHNALALYTMSPDDRLVTKTLALFDDSRAPNGLIRARWPARDSLFIAPYSFYWINGLHDFAWWRGEPSLVRSWLPGARAILDCFLGWVGPDGLLRIPFGWNFVDWVPEWPWGAPPIAADGAHAILHWHFVLTLQQAARLERAAGEPELATRCERHARQLGAAADRYWDEARGVYADTLDRRSYSEHAQVLAVLSGVLSPERTQRIRGALQGDRGLARTTFAFTHFLFECYRVLRLEQEFWARLEDWFGLEALGLLTTPEAPEPTRSDCHSWSAHPHYHFYASIVGLRPASPNFRTVSVTPWLGPLREVDVAMPHPAGEIRAHLISDDTGLHAEITLPENITGTCAWGGQQAALGPGRNVFSFKPNSRPHSE